MKELKIDLQALAAIPWYRIRLVHGCNILDNEFMDVCMATGMFSYLTQPGYSTNRYRAEDLLVDLQLLVIPFREPSPVHAHMFVEARVPRATLAPWRKR